MHASRLEFVPVGSRLLVLSCVDCAGRPFTRACTARLDQVSAPRSRTSAWRAPRIVNCQCRVKNRDANRRERKGQREQLRERVTSCLSQVHGLRTWSGLTALLRVGAARIVKDHVDWIASEAQGCDCGQTVERVTETTWRCTQCAAQVGPIQAGATPIVHQRTFITQPSIRLVTVDGREVHQCVIGNA